MSTFGRYFRVTTFGESHGAAVGAVIDGCPPRLRLCEADIQPQLNRRRPGQSRVTTARAEADRVSILSGTEGGLTLGTPVSLLVHNRNVKRSDYSNMVGTPRPGHADYTYQVKYGIKAATGGGRSSARETVGRVAAGAVAEKWLHEQYGTRVVCYVSAVGDVELPATGDGVQVCSGAAAHTGDAASDEAAFVAATKRGAAAARATFPAYVSFDGEWRDCNGAAVPDSARAGYVKTDEAVYLRCPCPVTACRMATLIRHVKAEKDSIGGVLACVCTGVPAGWGEPCFEKLEAELARAMMSLPATKGFEIGSGFAGTRMRGSQHNDRFVVKRTDGHGEARQRTAKRRRVGTADHEGGSTRAAAAATAVPTGHTGDGNGVPTAGAGVGAGAGAGVEDRASTAPRGRVNPVLVPATNHAGGTLGGISSGADIEFRVAIKPVSTIGMPQNTVTFAGEETVLAAKGRHDSCVLPRAPPLVEGMAALVLADAALLQRAREPREPAEA